MADCEIKYKKKESSIICGVVWGIMSLIWTILLIFIIYIRGFTPPLKIGYIYMVFIFLLNGILAFILAKYYITLSLQAYIKIYDDGLEIHKGLLRRSQLIDFKDIDEARLIGNKMYIILKDYVSLKEVEISLDLIYLKDLDRLLVDLFKNDIPIKKL
jgi:hypothetical protein